MLDSRGKEASLEATVSTNSNVGYHRITVAVVSIGTVTSPSERRVCFSFDQWRES